MDRFNNNDPLKQFVKGKLADYKAKMPPSGWEKLESSIFAAQKAKVVRRRWLASSMTAAAAALIGVFFVFQNLNRELPVQVSEHQVLKTESVEKDNNTPSEKQKKAKSSKSIKTLTADNTSTVKEKALNAYSKAQVQEKTPNEEIYPEKQDLTSTPLKKEHLTKKDDQSDIDDETKQRLIEEFINEGKRSLTSSDETSTSKIKKKRRNSISLTSQSGLSSSQQTNTIPSTLRSSVSDTYGTYTLSKMQVHNDEVEIKPKSEVNHMQPISFGILTSFNLSQKLQIETGLIYTYLSSETKNSSNDFNNSERVQFHYLGVPLNLNYTLASFNKLDLFATAGGMIEKDVNGKIKNNDEKKAPSLNSGYASSSSSKIKQGNPQFSVTGGVGITYPIYDKAQVFGKVGGRYYINANNEYKTFYSDQKFGLDIQLGIKFNF